MQLWALKEDYSISDIFAPLNVQWSRKYYEPGTFSIQIPYDQYNEDMVYVYRNDSDELGVIDDMQYTVSDQGLKAVQLTGKFLENELDDKVVVPDFNANGIIEDECVRMFNQYKADIPLLATAVSQGRGTHTDFVATSNGLATELYKALQSREYSFRVAYDYESNTKAFSIWQGKDRTQDQTENNPIIFSTAFKNLIKPDVKLQKNLKNFAFVKGSYNSTDITVEADLSNGGYKKQIVLDGSSIESEGLTESQYRAKLVSYGQTELLNSYLDVENILFDTDNESYEYRIDYDLGDKCTAIIEDLGITIEGRIISIYEVYKDNRRELSIELGNKKIVKRR